MGISFGSGGTCSYADTSAEVFLLVISLEELLIILDRLDMKQMMLLLLLAGVPTISSMTTVMQSVKLILSTLIPPSR